MMLGVYDYTVVLTDILYEKREDSDSGVYACSYDRDYYI